MATGARAWNILQQFLTEAWLVSAIGGLIGVGLGVAATQLIGTLGTPVHMTVLPMVLAFSCAFATGLIFGFLPARKAARLDPVHALASELRHDPSYNTIIICVAAGRLRRFSASAC